MSSKEPQNDMESSVMNMNDVKAIKDFSQESKKDPDDSIDLLVSKLPSDIRTRIIELKDILRKARSLVKELISDCDSHIDFEILGEWYDLCRVRGPRHKTTYYYHRAMHNNDGEVKQARWFGKVGKPAAEDKYQDWLEEKTKSKRYFELLKITERIQRRINKIVSDFSSERFTNILNGIAISGRD